MQGSGCGSGEPKPRCNLPAQLPFSNYSKRCSGHFSKKKKPYNKDTSATAPLKTPAAVCRSNTGQWLRLNARPLTLLSLTINLSQDRRLKRSRPRGGNKGRMFQAPKDAGRIYQLRVGSVINYPVLKWLKMLVRVIAVCATCVLSIWKPGKHMFASAFSSQDQLSSVTNIC